MEVNVRSGG